PSGAFSAESIRQCNESAGFRPTSRSWKRSNGIYEPFGVIVQSADPLSTGRLEDAVNARTARSWSSLRSEVAQGGNFGKSLKIPWPGRVGRWCKGFPGDPHSPRAGRADSSPSQAVAMKHAGVAFETDEAKF